MDSIIVLNEKAYNERYNISIHSLWNDLKEKERLEAINCVENLEKKGLTNSYKFKKESILRAYIGFDGKPCLDGILDNSVPTLKSIIWEPDIALFCAYCTHVDISEYILDRRLEFVIGCDKNSLEKKLRMIIRDNNAYHSEVKAICQYNKYDNYEVKLFVNLFEKIATEVTQDGYARKRFHKLPCKNFLYTIHTLSENYIVSQFFDAIPCRDIPVVLVSAGPSLVKNCKELKKAKGKTIIVAVTHAMKTLYNLGINPDLVAISDASETKFMDFDKDKKYTLLSSIYAEKECREPYNGRIIYHGFNMLGDLFSTKRTIEEKETELDTGSVATDVFSLFVSAGFKKIILVGQDLAYDEKGNTHAVNDPQKSDGDIINFEYETRGIYGGKVKTRPDWERFRAFFEKVIESNSDVEVIDATEGGAFIKGTKVMSLNEAILRYCDKTYPIDKWIKSMEKADWEEKENIAVWFEESKNNISRVRDWLEEIIILNSVIRQAWSECNITDLDLSASYRRYDVLYNQIMEGTRGELLRLYSIEDIQEYIENALLLEGDENIEKRMQMEQKLFSVLKEDSDELLTYLMSRN